MDSLDLARGRGPHFNEAEQAHAPFVGEQNVGEAERWASGLGGAMLILAGLRRGSLGGLGLAAIGGSLVYRATTGHCHAYSALGINTAKAGHDSQGHHVHKGRLVKHSVTIDRPAEELYRAWRDVEKAPRYMVDVESVRRTDDRHSHWTTKGPLGKTLSWDSEVFRDEPGHIIAWKTLPGADVNQAGAVRFEPATGGRGTVVTLEINFEPPAGIAGLGIARLLGKDPDHNVREDLRRFKQLMEAGELATVEGQPSGRA